MHLCVSFVQLIVYSYGWSCTNRHPVCLHSFLHVSYGLFIDDVSYQILELSILLLEQKGWIMDEHDIHEHDIYEHDIIYLHPRFAIEKNHISI